MSTTRSSQIIALFIASLLALVSRSAAQTGGSSPPQPPLVVKEQVEVVATRLPETPHEVPASIEVIDGDTLRAIGASNIREALSLAAGVEVGAGGDNGPAGAVPEFWGLREFDAFLLVVDEIPWGGAFNPALATLNLRDVERIEILRGSAPVTYGATSFAGVIHVVHKAAAADRSYFSARGGSFSSGGASVDLAMPAFGEWRSRLSVDTDRQGFTDDRTSFKRGHANYRGAKAANDRKTWFSADLNWLSQNPASPHVREGTALSAATPLDANYNPANAFLDDTRLSVSFGSERAVMPGINGARWTTIASYSHSGQSIFRGFLTDVSNTPKNATGFREDIDVNDVYANTYVTWSLRSHVQVVAGGDFLFGNGEGQGATFAYTVPLSGAATTVTEPTTLNLDTESRRAFSGGYAQLEWTPSTRVHLSTGLRLNATWERHGEGDGSTHVRPAGSVGAIFGLWDRGPDHVRLFANYRDTFKPAAFDFSLAENEGVLEPETARSYEGGVKVRAVEGRFDLEASGFRMDFENLVTSTVVRGLPSLQNAGSTRFQGFEIAAEGRAPRSVSGRATYSFHDGTFVDFVQEFGGTNTQLAGKRFEMSARHLFSAGLMVAPSIGVVGDVIVKYAGDRYLNKRNTALAEPFATVDIGVGYRFERVELRIDGRNLGDRRDPISESELGDAQYYRLPARRVDFTVGVRF
ncbi:MAG: TonB-dependent receptor [Acidobacteria bacterium]|nr:TonB-dependent receptor [Acidobacteriota bacterium]